MVMDNNIEKVEELVKNCKGLLWTNIYGTTPQKRCCNKTVAVEQCNKQEKGKEKKIHEQLGSNKWTNWNLNHLENLQLVQCIVCN